MYRQVIPEIQDLRRLDWSKVRHSSGTAGSFLKSREIVRGVKWYYKLSDYDAYRGIVGHECINELIADRLLTILQIPHLSYQLIHARIKIEENGNVALPFQRLQTIGREQNSAGYILSDGAADFGEPAGFLHTARMGGVRVSDAGHRLPDPES